MTHFVVRIASEQKVGMGRRLLVCGNGCPNFDVIVFREEVENFRANVLASRKLTADVRILVAGERLRLRVVDLAASLDVHPAFSPDVLART